MCPMGSSSFEVTTDGPGVSRRAGPRTPLMVGVVVVVILLVGLGIGLGVYFGLKAANTDPAPSPPATTGPSEAEMARIDCYPEAAWGTEVTKVKCEERGCTYVPSVTAHVPACYMARDSPLGRGYTVSAVGPRTESGFQLELTPRTDGYRRRREARPTRGLDNPVVVNFTVHYHGPNVVRIKVSVTI